MEDSPILEDALALFRNYKTMAEKAMAQVNDEEFFQQVDDESNSIALIVKHLAGNMRSRWSDFLTADGEKPDRDRDGEFVAEAADTRASVEARWNEGWRIALATLEGLSDKDLQRKVSIRGEPHTVLKAVNRNLTHLAYHTGQIAFLAKHLAGQRWQTLSMPRNRNRVSTRKATGKTSRPR
ncbi:MAG: DUF1572 family protein [Spirochaetia bacterium]